MFVCIPMVCPLMATFSLAPGLVAVLLVWLLLMHVTEALVAPCNSAHGVRVLASESSPGVPPVPALLQPGHGHQEVPLSQGSFLLHQSP